MRAVVVEAPRQVVVRDVAAPAPEGRVVVAVERAGLCGTDRSIVEGHIPVSFPRVIGHEIVGRVVDPGAEALAAGTRVLVDPSQSCGRCELCRSSLEHLCRRGALMGRDVDGGLAELVTAAGSQILPIPDTVGDDDASVLQVLGTCVHAQKLVDVFPNDVAVVVGLGVTGLLHLQLMAARGVTVIGVTRSALRREVARSLGATVAAPAEIAGVVAEATGGMGAGVVIEAVGLEATLAQSLELARPGGTVLAFGTITSGTGRLPYYDLYYKELRVLNSRAARPADYADAIDLVAAGSVRGAPMITSRLPLGEAPAVFARWASDEAQLKVVLEV